MTEEDVLLEPLKAYQNVLAARFHDNAEASFDALVASAGVSPEENAALMQERERRLTQKSGTDKKIRGKTLLRGLLIAALIVAFAVTFFAALSLFDGFSAIALVLVIVCPAAALGLLFLLRKKINPALTALRGEAANLDSKADEITRKAEAQMAPLNRRYDWNIPDRLIAETLPSLQLDKYFDEKKFDYFNACCDFSRASRQDYSLFRVRSGQADGLPFLWIRPLRQSFVDHTYTGTRLVTWQEREVDSKGNVRYVTHSQTLVATILRPAPDYTFSTQLLYGSDAAPDLHFSRSPVVPDGADDKKIDAIVRSGEKELEKKAEEAIKKGGSYSKMANSEFEVLFGAYNRDNENQFRLLFTPLAQRNMVALLRGGSPYGDDFSFVKNGKVNVIASRHGARLDIDADPARFVDFDLARAKKNYLAFNEEYFRSLYYDFLPLFCLPLYRQERPVHPFGACEAREEIGPWEAEAAVNTLDPALIAPADAATRSIAKVRALHPAGNATRADVTTYAFRGIPRVEIVPTLCRNGRVYPVSIPWIEYVPVTRDLSVELRAVTLTREEFLASPYASDRDVVFTGGMIARVL